MHVGDVKEMLSIRIRIGFLKFQSSTIVNNLKCSLFDDCSIYYNKWFIGRVEKNESY